MSGASVGGRGGYIGISAPLEFHDHHLCHAASAFGTSGFRKALVLSLDAYGDGRSGALYVGDGDKLEQLASFPPEVSLGEFYGAITALLGYRFGSDEGTTMALAALGEPVYEEALRRHLSVDGLALRGDLARWGRFTAFRFAHLSRCRPADVAASAQRLLEEMVVGLVENAVQETGLKNLCFAGGVALNVKLNQRLQSLENIRDMFVFPAAGDDGTAVGAAVLSQGKFLRGRLRSAALGTSYAQAEMDAEATRSGFSVCQYDSSLVAKTLSEGSLVGWFDGGMEFGPRALGKRSLLADPRSLESPEAIRRTIKRRPAFQPFCPSLTPRFARALLHNPKRIDASFMTFGFGTRENTVPAIVHLDGSCRPHVVDRHDARYFDLLEAFGDISGVQCLLNTSLNRSGEPIVRSPEQAVRLLAQTDLDALVLGDIMISKT